MNSIATGKKRAGTLLEKKRIPRIRFILNVKPLAIMLILQ